MQNIVGTFDDPNSARLAIGRLYTAGIPRDRVHFDPSLDTDFLKHAGPSQPRPGDPNYHHQSVLESIGGFFANLLESHTDESGIYSEALRRGTSLVFVQAERDEATRVIRILQDCGAIKLEDRVGQWRAEGWHPQPSGTAAASPSPSPAGSGAAGVTGGASTTLRGGPVGTQSFTGGGAAVGMPTTAASQVGGAGARPDGADMADTGRDPTLPSSQTPPTPAESARLHERAMAASPRDETARQDRVNREREPGRDG
ncbi:hypothetical protein [Ramlibacter rhizophilus]|uniref:Uncharacterized protein n=1 Tax=Ramlibacter rhizophilus TaxID=1781167 RepID=A0A4Z0BZZ3_9BURK|nr:hypothetical protein [Ramlibacter rhizophilus]TFZ04866.1 hypothetical protein EZ242_03725 [Ramlibacter rhizophilus]